MARTGISVRAQGTTVEALKESAKDAGCAVYAQPVPEGVAIFIDLEKLGVRELRASISRLPSTSRVYFQDLEHRVEQELTDDERGAIGWSSTAKHSALSCAILALAREFDKMLRADMEHNYEIANRTNRSTRV